MLTLHFCCLFSDGCQGIWEIARPLYGYHEKKYCKLRGATGYPVWKQHRYWGTKCMSRKNRSTKTEKPTITNGWGFGHRMGSRCLVIALTLANIVLHSHNVKQCTSKIAISKWSAQNVCVLPENRGIFSHGSVHFDILSITTMLVWQCNAHVLTSHFTLRFFHETSHWHDYVTVNWWHLLI